MLLVCLCAVCGYFASRYSFLASFDKYVILLKSLVFSFDIEVGYCVCMCVSLFVCGCRMRELKVKSFVIFTLERERDRERERERCTGDRMHYGDGCSKCIAQSSVLC